MSSRSGCGRRFALGEQRGARVLRDVGAEDGAPVLERQQPVRLSLAEHGRDLLVRPGEGEALDAVGVRVLRRGEPALGQPQLPQHVVQGLLGHAAVALVPGHDPGVQVGRGEERVVVEHLLEVRDEPVRVHGVAVEAAAEQVVHAACGHAVEGEAGHAERVLVARRGWRRSRSSIVEAAGNLGAGPQPPSAGRSCGAGPGRRRSGARSSAARRGRPLARLADRVDERVRLLLEVGAPRPVGLRHRLQHLPEARQAVPRLGREVGAAVERARRPASGRRSSASRRGRSWRRRRPCRARRRPAAPRGRP